MGLTRKYFAQGKDNPQISFITVSIQMLYEKNRFNIFCECESEFFLYSMFLANAKSNFGAMFWLYFMEFFGFSGKMVFFPMRISEMRFLLCEIGPCLLAFVKHLYTYGIEGL